MTDNEYLLIHILDCGTLDLNRLHEIIDFMEDVIPADRDYLKDAINEINDCNTKLTFNTLVYELFVIIIDNIINAVGDNTINYDDFIIDTNYLDSHLEYIGDNKKVHKWLIKHPTDFILV